MVIKNRRHKGKQKLNDWRLQSKFRYLPPNLLELKWEERRGITLLLIQNFHFNIEITINHTSLFQENY